MGEFLYAHFSLLTREVPFVRLALHPLAYGDTVPQAHKGLPLPPIFAPPCCVVIYHGSSGL